MNFPCYEAGQAITAGTASAPTALSGAAVAAARDVLIWNPGPNLVHVRAGDASVVADLTCAPVPPGTLWVYSKAAHTHLATRAVGSPQAIVVILGRWD